MAKRQTDRQRLARKIESLDDTQVNEVLDYIAIMEVAKRTAASRGVREDEVISVLADAHENRRARQAFEWESVRRRAERRATSISTRA